MPEIWDEEKEDFLYWKLRFPPKILCATPVGSNHCLCEPGVKLILPRSKSTRIGIRSSKVISTFITTSLSTTSTKAARLQADTGVGPTSSSLARWYVIGIDVKLVVSNKI